MKAKEVKKELKQLKLSEAHHSDLIDAMRR